MHWIVTTKLSSQKKENSTIGILPSSGPHSARHTLVYHFCLLKLLHPCDPPSKSNIMLSEDARVALNRGLLSPHSVLILVDKKWGREKVTILPSGHFSCSSSSFLLKISQKLSQDNCTSQWIYALKKTLKITFVRVILDWNYETPSHQKMKTITLWPCSNLQEFTFLPDFSMPFHYLFVFINRELLLEHPREDTILAVLTGKVKGKEGQWQVLVKTQGWQNIVARRPML